MMADAQPIAPKKGCLGSVARLGEHAEQEGWGQCWQAVLRGNSQHIRDWFSSQYT